MSDFLDSVIPSQQVDRGVFNARSADSSDFYGTPDHATRMLIPYLDYKWHIWEPCAGFGAIVNCLKDAGFVVDGSDLSTGLNALTGVPVTFDFDCIVTNPPYSLKTEFLQRCYELGKPFALLMPCDLVNGRRTALMAKHGVQLIVPHQRIKFLRFDRGEVKEAPSPNMGSCWFTWKLNLPKDIVFV